MKKFMTSIKTLAALLMAGAAFSACSSSDDNIANEQPANPTQPQVYTMVIKASKGGDATTRALQGGDGSVTAYWNGNETIDVVQDNGTTKEKIGTASAAESSDGSTTITATLTSEPTGDLYFVLGGTTWNYTGQNGLLVAPESTQVTNISKDYDFAVAELAADKYTKNGTVITPSATLNFVSRQAIVKFILKDKANGAPINATQLTIDAKVNDESRLVQSFTLPSTQTLGPITINRTTPTDNVVYAALSFSSQAINFTYALTATDGTHNYTYEKSNVAFTHDKYYEVTVKMTRDTYPIALSEVTSDNLGNVVTTDGTVYATVADAIAAEKTAAGMIAYVSGIGQGLAIALADESGSMNWNTAKSTCEGKTAVTGYSWKLPTKEEWNQMFSANGGSEGSYTVLNTALAAAGGDGSKLQDDIYWSSTPYDEVNAWRVHLDEGTTYWNTLLKSVNNQVRACLAFGYARGHALASSAVGEIVGSDGLAYYASDKNDLPSGVTAVAMVAYKSATAGESLAIQLNDSPASMSWSDACNYSGYPSITGNPGTWHLPSKADWQNMFVGCAKSGDAGASDKMSPIVGFMEKIGAAGITWQAYQFWSSTVGELGAWWVNVNLYTVRADFYQGDSSNLYYVLGCLAF